MKATDANYQFVYWNISIVYLNDKAELVGLELNDSDPKSPRRYRIEYDGTESPLTVWVRNAIITDFDPIKCFELRMNYYDGDGYPMTDEKMMMVSTKSTSHSTAHVYVEHTLSTGELHFILTELVMSILNQNDDDIQIEKMKMPKTQTSN